MMTSKFFLAAYAALVIAVAPLQTAVAADDGTRKTAQVHTQTRYSSRSAEAAQIRAWLERHAAYYPSGAQIGDPGKITGAKGGTILVEKSRSIPSGALRSLSVTAQGREPPVPLPGSGNSGDTISITYSVGPYTYSWTYTWFVDEDGLGGSWVLLDYEMHFDPTYQIPR